jgi:hypothetical protein
MAAAVYALCALASIACMVLLWRGYWRSRRRLLLWSSLCFAGLSANNALLFVDKILVPDENLSLVRSVSALAGLLLLLYGLVWDAER